MEQGRDPLNFRTRTGDEMKIDISEMNSRQGEVR